MRNRFKRVIREFFRLNYNNFPPHTDIVIGIKPVAANKGVESLRLQLSELVELLKR